MPRCPQIGRRKNADRGGGRLVPKIVMLFVLSSSRFSSKIFRVTTVPLNALSCWLLERLGRPSVRMPNWTWEVRHSKLGSWFDTVSLENSLHVSGQHMPSTFPRWNSARGQSPSHKTLCQRQQSTVKWISFNSRVGFSPKRVEDYRESTTVHTTQMRILRRGPSKGHGV